MDGGIRVYDKNRILDPIQDIDKSELDSTSYKTPMPTI